MTPAVEYSNVTFSYSPRGDGAASGGLALEGVSLVVAERERLGILGPNGGGKSTLLKLTLGLLGLQEGSIKVFGQTPAAARRQRLIGYVPQRVEAELGFPLSGRQVVELGAAIANKPWQGLSSEQRKAVDDAMAITGATGYADKHVGAMSGGQLQRILIARALAARPRLLLLDEPTVGIDPAGQQQFAELLGTLSKERGLTVIVVSHDLRTIAAGCDRVACLSRTLHSHTDPQGLTPAVLAEVFKHDVAAVFGELHVDAHSAHACTDPSHHHGHGARGSGGVVSLGVSAKKSVQREGLEGFGKGESRDDREGGNL
ncbi:MAG: metal ABC transporter ATP-binding protein [Phycisphaerales bacterium]